MVLVTRPAPDFTAAAVLGNGEIVENFNFKQHTNGKATVLFFWPMDFTFVCPSELIAFDKRYEEFQKRGVEVERSDIMAVARQYNQLYKTEDMLNVIDAGIGVAEELIATAETPDDVKKISEAIAKLVNTRLLLEGKANSISESRKASPVDLEIMALIDEQRKQNDMHEQTIANAQEHK